jgi:hypothetical protein
MVYSASLDGRTIIKTVTVDEVAEVSYTEITMVVVVHKIENVCECFLFSMVALYKNLFCLSKHNDFVVCNLRNVRGIY